MQLEYKILALSVVSSQYKVQRVCVCVCMCMRERESVCVCEGGGGVVRFSLFLSGSYEITTGPIGRNLCLLLFFLRQFNS
jgi:hypothetical protein